MTEGDQVGNMTPDKKLNYQTMSIKSNKNSLLSNGNQAADVNVRDQISVNSSLPRMVDVI